MLAVQDHYSREQVMQYFQKCAKEVKNALINISLSANFLSIIWGDLVIWVLYMDILKQTKLLNYTYCKVSMAVKALMIITMNLRELQMTYMKTVDSG